MKREKLKYLLALRSQLDVTLRYITFIYTNFILNILLFCLCAVPGAALRAGSGFRKPGQRSEPQQLSFTAVAADASN
jgi:hypothetical protein